MEGEHVEVVTRQVALGIIGHHAHVGHSLVGALQDVVAIVLVVVGEGHVHRGAELDAVAHLVVQRGALGELVHLLSDDGADALVVAGTDAELGLFTTAGEVDVIAVLLTELLHLVHPIGVVVEVVVDVGFVGVVVQLGDASSDAVALCGIEVCLFQHHGVAVTVQHLVAVGLPGAVELIGEVHLCGTTTTAAQLDFDNTVGTSHTPLGGGSGILQYGDALDILGVHVQQGRELLLVIHILEVHALGVLGQIKDMVVHHNQGLCVAVDGGGTAQAHGGTGTQVT